MNAQDMDRCAMERILHPLLGHILALEDKKADYPSCKELTDLIDTALLHMKDDELENDLLYFKLDICKGVDMQESFEELIDKSIVHISTQLYPILF
jgi:hypothetical protein